MKNIVLISIDNLRFDCIGYQPDKKELVKYDVLKHLETPTLDRLAEHSHCFTQCTSTNTYTTSAHASMLTGLYPPRHGVRGFFDKKLSREIFTLAEVLKMFGYETVMLTDTENLFLPLEMHRGFDHVFVIDDAALLKFLEERKGEKLFVFAHLYDVHEPFLLSKNPRYISGDYLDVVKSLYENHHLELSDTLRTDFKYNRKLWLRLLDHIGYKSHGEFFPLYVRGVSRFDQGRFRDFVGGIDSLGLFGDSLTVIVSDHGEGKSDDENPDHFTHGVRLFDSVIRVPLMIYHRDFSHHLVHDTTSIVDIFPTIMDFAVGEEAAGLLPYPLDGVSLKTPLKAEKRAVYSETWKRDDNDTFTAPPVFMSYFMDQRALRTNEAKYIVNGEPEGLELQDSLNHLSDELFIQYVHRGLLRRFEFYGEYLSVLKGLKARMMTRTDYLNKVLSFQEYGAKPHYVMYDLLNDPYEEKPLNLTDAAARDGESVKYLDAIKDLSKSPVLSEEIFPGDKDTILGIFKNSGKRDWEEKATALLDNKHLLTSLIDQFLRQEKMNKIARDRERVKNVVLSSKEFSLFVYNNIAEKSGKIPFLRRILIRFVPYRTQLRVYDFLSLKIFPERTFRGRLWHRVVSKILSV